MYDRFLEGTRIKRGKSEGFSRKPRLLQFPSSPIHSSMVNSYRKHGVHPYYLLQKEASSQLHQIDNMTEQCSLFHTCTFKHCWLVDNLYWLVIIVVSFGTEISCVMLVTVLIFTSKKIIPFLQSSQMPYWCVSLALNRGANRTACPLVLLKLYVILQQPHNWRT